MTDLETLRDHARKMAASSSTTTAERALWEQIAQELDAYLDHDPGPDLFGELA